MIKITFLGISGALSPKYNSNMIIESGGTVLLFDCGEDVMHSLKSANRSPDEITDVYISHLHYDHCGGMSWLGYYSYFVTKKKINLHIHESMVSDLWAMLRPAMEKMHKQEKMMSLNDYFNIHFFGDEDNFVDCGGFDFLAIKQPHILSPNGNMYSYGMLIGDPNDSCWKIFISSDTCYALDFNHTFIDEIRHKNITHVFFDCDVMNLNGVHPNYKDLKKMSPSIKNKTWLYHYTNLDDYDGKFGKMPDAVKDGFAGFVKEGQVFEI